jgi:hypothetical protein
MRIGKTKAAMGAISSIILLVVIFWLGTMIIRSFSRGKRVMTVPSQITAITGMYTLILYGGRHSNDLETVAILSKENGRYAFEPFAPEFKYTVKKGVPAKEALAEAEMFVRWHNSFQQSKIRGIIDDKGNTLGYEVRPLYLPLTFGAEDVVDVNYKMETDRIIVYVSLSPSVEKILLS